MIPRDMTQEQLDALLTEGLLALTEGMVDIGTPQVGETPIDFSSYTRQSREDLRHLGRASEAILAFMRHCVRVKEELDKQKEEANDE